MIALIKLLDSATYTTPARESIAIPDGFIKLAEVPIPLDEPLTVLPASVETVTQVWHFAP